MEAPKILWYDDQECAAGPVQFNSDEVKYVRADLVDGLVKIMEDFPGFTEDAAVGDAWVESLWAALKALESAEIGRGME